MITNIIAVLLISFFMLVIAIGVWSFTRLHKIGLLTGFMQGRWLLSLLTSLFIVSFIVGGIALLMRAEWAAPLLCYTIYPWLVYVWLYNLKKLLDMVALLKWEKAKSFSQFMGRSKFFDELVEKSIELSKQAAHPSVEVSGEAHAVTDPSLEELLNDEELFKEILPKVMRKKIRRKVIGLIVQTVIFLLIVLWLS